MASTTTTSSSSSARKTIREVFPRICIGRYTPGPANTLTDVPGVLVSTLSIQKPNTATPEPVPGGLAGVRTRHAINTGVTTILPRRNWFHEGCYAGLFRFNGSGELTGSHWLEETGQLHSPIVLTNSFAVGPAYSGIYEYAVREYSDPDSGLSEWFLLPVVAETCDLHMSDIGAMPVSRDMVVKSIEQASSNPVPQGNTGGGTGMLCQGFKGGTGSASRIINGKVHLPGEEARDVQYTLGVLVQANYGAQWDLHIGRVPVGRLMMDEKKRAEWEKHVKSPKDQPKDGSIIAIVATDAPLHPLQLQRLAKRATVGLARVGGWGTNTSGDIFLAFSTAEHLKKERTDGRFDTLLRDKVGTIVDDTSNALFEAVADCTEESIYNALCMAQDMEGPMGRSVKAINLDVLQALLEKHCVV